LDASQVGRTLRVDDTLGPAQGWPPGVPGQAGTSLVAIDDLGVKVLKKHFFFYSDVRAK
jgi:hypothetical protein